MTKKSTMTSPSRVATIHDQKLHRGEPGDLHQFADDGSGPGSATVSPIPGGRTEH